MVLGIGGIAGQAPSWVAGSVTGYWVTGLLWGCLD